MFIAIEIGCLECCNKSRLIGVFDKLQDAKEICEKENNNINNHGDYYCCVFEFKEINKILFTEEIL